MTRLTEGTCQTAEQLAAYIDGRLPARDLARLERHLLSCLDCQKWLAEAVWAAEPATATSAAPTGVLVPFDPVLRPASTRRWGAAKVLGSVAAAAAVVAYLLNPGVLPGATGGDQRLADLAVAAGVSRPVVGRLTGGFPHASLVAPSAGGQGGAVVEPVVLRQAASKIRESIDQRQTPERLHAYGVSQLLLHRYDEAVLALAAAAREQPDRAEFAADVAAAYLERAGLGVRADDLPRALAAAEQARAAKPALLEAWFNRALAFTALSLHDQARQAWSDYLSRDAASPWAVEARSRLAQIEGPTPAEQWAAIAARLAANVDQPTADEAVRVQTTEARDYLENVLIPTWAGATTAGRDASRELDAVRTMADAFARISGDNLYRDAIGAIDRAEGRGPTALHRLAQAHATYASAAALVRAEQFSAARPALAQAVAALTNTGSAFASRAALDVATATFYSRPVSDTTLALDAAAAMDGADYPYVTGRIAWTRGLVAFNEGRFADVRAQYEHALSTFDRAGDTEQAAAVHVLLANLHDFLGDPSTAWQQRALALQYASSPRLRHGLLISIAGETLTEQGPQAALPLQDALLANALALGRAAFVVEARAQRAVVVSALGRAADADAELAKAQTALAGVTDPAFRTRLEGRLLEATADVHADRHPKIAASAAERALAAAGTRGDRTRVPHLSVLLARARLAQGNAAEARIAVESALAALPAVGAPRLGRGDVHDLLNLAIRFSLDAGDNDRAFKLAQRARAFNLNQAQAPAPISQSEVQGRLSSDEAVVALTQLDSELVVWFVSGTATQVVRRPLSMAQATRLAERYRDEIALAAGTPSASAALFNELVRPFTGRLSAVRRLTIVPDAPFYSVSFPGLWDRQRNRFLVEQASIRVVAAIGAGRAASPAPAPATAPAFVHIGRPTSRDAALTALSAAAARSVATLAGPAVANQSDPALSRVVLGDEPGRPYSGSVMAAEIAARDLSNLHAVVLTDCRSGSSVTGVGALGVAAPFLQAGVPSVVATLGSLSSDDGSVLFDELQQLLARHDQTAEAVSDVQRNALQSQRGHRLGAWAELVVYGAGR
jgi:tetratricopeptide (TPR) repeat protein